MVTGVAANSQSAARMPTGGKGLGVASSGESELEATPAQRKAPQSAMVTPNTQCHIPINKAHLEYINSDPEAIRGIENTHPYVSMTVNHRKQEEPPSTEVYECIRKFYNTSIRQTQQQL
jgi:hypothetical protein